MILGSFFVKNDFFTRLNINMIRALLLGIICWLTLSPLIAQGDDSYIIRRVYIDVLGVVPTAEEVDWYCVYNGKTSYKLAVEWVLHHSSYKWDMIKGDARTYLHSDLYKTFKKMPLSTKQLNNIILYVAGDTHEATEENIRKSKQKIITHAIDSTSDDLEAIDYICYRFMSRVTHLDEANYLSKKLKELKKTKSQDEAWLDLFNEILSLEDVRCR